ncbi:tRNA (5-methylaminomethyl-2-thiouridine)(34)-methyltransferase MnmD [Hymenobacter sp. RP-2-7]|uniref:tRNA (5-methylaminomethyl-2-thiouridine)(34)-methyltransferase MnmD n=1 Tax=Hymenobacter polaris TaxID=2682546 RepID=A0A7Y0FNK0_9BACT|nr:tRNA (5-methylaminomethyl-2-thiouridine)(34)-methyltransferase MnmD [Hymenobacter polaris]NML66988.1 tRNA (5-methylaminomethyl-2-thiouridine)(34)-methyltransferase MnmD [Hymenobacter polaris]
MSNEQLSDGDGPAEAPKVEVRTTADGSPTLYVPALNEHYHSTHGARQESQHVFIEAGLRPLLAAGLGQQEPLKVLEVGLGTGLNALLTLEATQAVPGATVAYDGYETHPLPPEAVAALAPQWAASEVLSRVFAQLHREPWGRALLLTSDFLLRKVRQPLQAATLPAAAYDLIYFDAFAPEKQPELWTEDIFAKLYYAAAPGAVLVSYCAQGQFRRNLRAAGWLTEKLPGPPGKREMTRARKPA